MLDDVIDDVIGGMGVPMGSKALERGSCLGLESSPDSPCIVALSSGARFSLVVVVAVVVVVVAADDGR